jgi:hypothetical protein
MTLEDRPYVDPDTTPGDAGTEEWADKTSGSGGEVGRGPLAEPTEETTDKDGVVEGSPADEFINDADAIGARDEGDKS